MYVCLYVANVRLFENHPIHQVIARILNEMWKKFLANYPKRGGHLNDMVLRTQYPIDVWITLYLEK